MRAEGWVIGIKEGGLTKTYIVYIDGVGEITIYHDHIKEGKFPIHVNDWVELTIEVRSST